MKRWGKLLILGCLSFGLAQAVTVPALAYFESQKVYWVSFTTTCDNCSWIESTQTWPLTSPKGNPVAVGFAAGADGCTVMNWTERTWSFASGGDYWLGTQHHVDPSGGGGCGSTRWRVAWSHT